LDLTLGRTARQQNKRVTTITMTSLSRVNNIFDASPAPDQNIIVSGLQKEITRLHTLKVYMKHLICYFATSIGSTRHGKVSVRGGFLICSN
jgi:hypothetical protein